MHEQGTVTTVRTSNNGVDDDERQTLRNEGLDPDDPAVIAAIDLVRWELSLGTCVTAPARRESAHVSRVPRKQSLAAVGLCFPVFCFIDFALGIQTFGVAIDR